MQPTATPEPAAPSSPSIIFSILKLFSFLFTYDFWSRTAFFVGYVLTFWLVLEVARLVGTDANRKQVEKMLDAYAEARREEVVEREKARAEMEKRSRTAAPVKEMKKVSLEALEEMERQSVVLAEREERMRERERRMRTPSPDLRRKSEILDQTHHVPAPVPVQVYQIPHMPMLPTEVDIEPEVEIEVEQRPRRKRSPSAAIAAAAGTQKSTTRQRERAPSSPNRRLRKRSDTLNSSGTSAGEVKEVKEVREGTVRRKKREVSPAEVVVIGGKGERVESPSRKSRSKEGKGLGLGRMLRARG